MAINRKEVKDIAVGVGFLLPNILGFLAFTVIPLAMSIYMAFTDWNLEMHNYFRLDTPVRWVGFANFVKLFTDPDFGQYFGNTFFLMIGMPFGVAGSLCAALLLNIEFKGGRRIFTTMIITAVMVASLLILLTLGLGGSGMTILMMSLIGVILIIGSIGGKTVYRTLFYFPFFTSGVATYILWKKLYAPNNGPINNALRPVLEALTPVAQKIAPACSVIATVLLVLMGVWFLLMVRRKMRLWRDGESGNVSIVLGMIFLSLPPFFSLYWTDFEWVRIVMPLFLAVGWLMFFFRVFILKRKYTCVLDRGIGDSAIVDGAQMVGGFILIGFANVALLLPELSSQPGGLPAPEWLADYYWAKPSIMLMGFWGAIGSNNMLLYLAGLSGVPQELYEAADIDGASPWQRFWNITWPQLSNVTFFIMVMGVIGGLQGGFEMARTMTQGGPAGSTTTLAYYIYTQGFSTGRLGYASAVAWLLFLLVFIVTMFNWKFGNRYTNE